jgi:alpha-L-rhamnosidase
MISNIHSIPTDCPHREKNGWMGDAVTGIEMGMANYDLAALITKFTRDVFDTQDSEGRMSTIAPDNDYTKGLSPLWSSACVHLPWYMYNYYGDTRLFEHYWEKMKLYTDGVWEYKQVEGKPGIFTDVLADWCSPHGNISDEGPEIYTTMNFFLVLKRLSYMANIFGKKNDFAEFEKQAEQVREAIYKYCFDEKNVVFGGVTTSGYRQGPNAMALQYEIVKPEHRNQVLEKLLNDISVNRHNHFYGGIFTGHALWELIPQTGNAELAYKVAVNDTYPGYGYMLKNGATTVWEHWDDKASHIHYFMGFVDNFLIRHIAGINSDINNPGFKTVRIEPNFIEALSNSSAVYNSIHGPISVKWERTSPSTYSLQILVPVNCDAEFILPEKCIGPKVDGTPGKVLKDEKNNRNFIAIKSGSYQIDLKTGNL